jgi:hypothetical protein
MKHSLNFAAFDVEKSIKPARNFFAVLKTLFCVRQWFSVVRCRHGNIGEPVHS